MARKKLAPWVTYEKDEIGRIIAKLAKEGNSPAKTGLILRDRYGIPNARKYGYRISHMTRERGRMPEDMFTLTAKAVNLRDHLARLKKDAKARHALDGIESDIRRLGKYYSRKGLLPADWRYDPDRARLLVKGLGEIIR